MKKLNRGIFIAFEGIDGAGKSTQAKKCLDHFLNLGYDTILLREPTDGPIGKKIRQLAQAGRDKISPMEEFSLFLEDRKEDYKLNIKPALDAGKIVLIDRYYYSSIAYQGALGLDPEFIKTENEKIAPPADIMFYIYIPSELSSSRIEVSRGESVNLFEKKEYLEKVKNIFDNMKNPEICRINGARSFDEIQNDINNEIQKLVDSLS